MGPLNDAYELIYFFYFAGLWNSGFTLYDLTFKIIYACIGICSETTV